MANFLIYAYFIKELSMYILTIFFTLFLNLLFSSNLHYDMMCCRRNEHDTKSFDDSTL